MTPWQNRATELTQRMADDMKLRNYSQKTIDAYTYHLGKFARFLGKSPHEATAEDVRSFQLHMIDARKLQWSSFNQAVCGLRFFFRTTCPQSWHVEMISASERPARAAAVLSGEEVNKGLSCVKCHKHRVFLLVQYAAGMRLNEAAHLKLSDIDSARMQLRIGNGKGQKTRIVPMAPRLLTELREYWRVYRPSVYLFPGRTPDTPLQPTTIRFPPTR